MMHTLQRSPFAWFQPSPFTWLHAETKAHRRANVDSLKQSDSANLSPAFDLLRNPQHYVIRLAMPGVSLDAVDIRVATNQLSISGKQSALTQQAPDTSDQDANEDEGGSTVYQGLGAADFHRSFTLPEDVVVEKIAASAENGIVTIHVPRRMEQEPRRIPVGRSLP